MAAKEIEPLPLEALDPDGESGAADTSTYPGEPGSRRRWIFPAVVALLSIALVVAVVRARDLQATVDRLRPPGAASDRAYCLEDPLVGRITYTHRPSAPRASSPRHAGTFGGSVGGFPSERYVSAEFLDTRVNPAAVVTKLGFRTSVYGVGRIHAPALVRPAHVDVLTFRVARTSDAKSVPFGALATSC